MDSPETQATQESRLHFLDYWRIIRIRKAIIISVFFITTIIAIVVTFLMKPAYSSTTSIEINPDLVSDVPTINGGGGSMAPYDPYFMETELKTIQGQAVLSQVVNDLSLDQLWGKKINPDGQPLKMTDAIDYLRRMISLDADRNTKLIDITVFNEDKNLAANIANDIATAYKNYRIEQHGKQMQSGIEKLGEDYSNEEVTIYSMQTNVDHLRNELKINDTDPTTTGPTPTIAAEQVQHLNELLIEGDSAYTRLQSQYNEFQNIQATNPTVLGDVLLTINSDAMLSDLLGKLHANEQKIVEQQIYLGSNNPDMNAAVSLSATLKDEIKERVDGIMDGLESNLKAQGDEVLTLSNKLQNFEQDEENELQRGQPYWEAKRHLVDQLTLHQLLAAHIESDKADALIPKTTLVTVINPATPSDIPVRPLKKTNIGLGAFFGLLVGVALAFFIEYLDTSVKTIDEVERVFQAPVLGVIPQNVGKLIEQGQDGSHAEAYRVLRTNILFSRKDENLNSLVVVSAGMGEGKSTTVLNLATVFAQAGQRTLVVDSDLRRPTLHKLLGLTNNTGLINYLLKQNTLEQVVQQTPVPMLDFLASGKLPGGGMSVLGSEQMRNLISELKQRYDFILFDSPPIMGLSDASVLASEVDLAIQIIQYRRYPQLMNIRAKQMVEKVGGNLIGIVLNNINMAQDESYYYYGGYYYHNNDDSQGNSSKGSSSGDDESGNPDRPGIQQKY
jgi:capsular exopolysaccharide synthesis family protein